MDEIGFQDHPLKQVHLNFHLLFLKFPTWQAITNHIPDGFQCVIFPLTPVPFLFLLTSSLTSLLLPFLVFLAHSFNSRLPGSNRGFLFSEPSALLLLWTSCCIYRFLDTLFICSCIFLSFPGHPSCHSLDCSCKMSLRQCPGISVPLDGCHLHPCPPIRTLFNLGLSSFFPCFFSAGTLSPSSLYSANTTCSTNVCRRNNLFDFSTFIPIACTHTL